MPRKKKQRVQEEVIVSTDVVQVNFLSPGQFVVANDGEFRQVMRIDPVLDCRHPKLQSNEVVAYLDHGGKTIPTYLKGEVRVKAA